MKIIVLLGVCALAVQLTSAQHYGRGHYPQNIVAAPSHCTPEGIYTFPQTSRVTNIICAQMAPLLTSFARTDYFTVKRDTCTGPVPIIGMSIVKGKLFPPQ